MEAHLRSDLVEGSGEEVGAPHPGSQRSEGVFDRLAAHGHGVGHAVEPGLHLVHDGFVPPAPEPPEFVRRALGFERAGEAGGQVTIFVQVAFGVGTPPALRQLRPAGQV